MFDVSFTELLLIGIIALIVIGPERLPGVARTIGHLVGRAQRYVNEVKADIQREVDLSEITNLKDQISDAANSMKASLETATEELRKPIQETQDAFKDASNSVNSLLAEAKTSVKEAADGVKQIAAPASGAAAAEAPVAQIADAAPAAPAIPVPTASTPAASTPTDPVATDPVATAPVSAVPVSATPASAAVNPGPAESPADTAHEPPPPPVAEPKQATPAETRK
ncbi:MAG: twin-arginine translocase subunit TatB [Candidimonas sp.]|nr:MAG: twin-arginine translocase subunit TatB [Candidimonas sp.]